MTQAELFQHLKTLGLPVAYRGFVETEENPVPTPPFIVYRYAYDSGLKADNENYLDVENYQVELYTVKKDTAKEKLVQDKLKEIKLPYTKVENYIEDEKVIQIVYEVQLIGG